MDIDNIFVSHRKDVKKIYQDKMDAATKDGTFDSTIDKVNLDDSSSEDFPRQDSAEISASIYSMNKVSKKQKGSQLSNIVFTNKSVSKYLALPILSAIIYWFFKPSRSLQKPLPIDYRTVSKDSVQSTFVIYQDKLLYNSKFKNFINTQYTIDMTDINLNLNDIIADAYHRDKRIFIIQNLNKIKNYTDAYAFHSILDHFHSQFTKAIFIFPIPKSYIIKQILVYDNQILKHCNILKDINNDNNNNNIEFTDREWSCLLEQILKIQWSQYSYQSSKRPINKDHLESLLNRLFMHVIVVDKNLDKLNKIIE